MAYRSKYSRMKPVVRVRLPVDVLCDSLELAAARAGVSVDDYIYYQLVEWGRREPDLYRERWRELLDYEGLTIRDCDARLQATTTPTYDQTMRMFLHIGQMRHGKYRHLKVDAVKALSESIGLSAKDLMAGLGQLKPLPLIGLMEVELPASLATRIAMAANSGDRWMALMRKRIKHRYGEGRGGYQTGELAEAMAKRLGLNLHTIYHTLTPSQRHSKMWDGAKITVVCDLLAWPLEKVAKLLKLEEPVRRFHWPVLAPIELPTTVTAKAA